MIVRQRWRRVRASLAVGAIVVGSGLAVSGCTAARNDLGTSESVCYLALPAATAAVHHRGHLDGVHFVGMAALRTFSAPLYHAARSYPGAKVQRVCLVAFTGHFSASDVTSARGVQAGHLAIVALSYPGSRLLATLLVERARIPFGHSHIAPL